MSRLLDVLFGCSHKSLSFPITRRRAQNSAAAGTIVGTYVVCLDCGKEFAYDWQRMKRVDSPVAPSKGLRAKPAKAA